MKCPRCVSIELVSEQYEGVEIDRCPSCKGAWLDDREINTIVDVREKTFSKNAIDSAVSARISYIPKAEQASHRLCPRCGTAMLAMNYAYDSGVILDRCPKGHGLWFDDGELEKVQMYREHFSDVAKTMEPIWTKTAQGARHSSSKAPYSDLSLSPFKLLVNLLHFFSK